MRGVRVIPIHTAMDQAKSRFGFFVLLSNEVKTSQMALEIYRNKDVVEKAFGVKAEGEAARMEINGETTEKRIIL